MPYSYGFIKGFVGLFMESEVSWPICLLRYTRGILADPELFFKDFFRFVNFCARMFSLYICMYTTCVPGVNGGQKRVPDSLKLEIRMIMSHQWGSGETNMFSGIWIYIIYYIYNTMRFLDVMSFFFFFGLLKHCYALEGPFIWILISFILRSLSCIIPMVVSCFLFHFLKPCQQFFCFHSDSHTGHLGEPCSYKVRWQTARPWVFYMATRTQSPEEESLIYPLFSSTLLFLSLLIQHRLHLFVSNDCLSTL